MDALKKTLHEHHALSGEYKGKGEREGLRVEEKTSIDTAASAPLPDSAFIHLRAGMP
jgi:hypothetical protein